MNALLTQIEGLLPSTPKDPHRTQLLRLLRAFSARCLEEARSLGPIRLGADIEAHVRRLADRVVFICGAPRSGTSLTRALLDDRPGLAVLPSEGTFVSGLGVQVRLHGVGALWEEWIRRLIDPNLGPHLKLGKSPGNYVDFARALAAFWNVVQRDVPHHGDLGPHTAVLLTWAYVHHRRSLENVQWLVEKTPGNERHAEILAERFREARFIHVVRDPRAIYRSHVRLGELYPSIRLNRGRVLEGIRTSFVSARRSPLHLGSSRYFLLRYEDLVADAGRVLHPILSALGIDPGGAWVPTEAGRPLPSNSSFDRASSGVYRQSAAQRPELAPAELERLTAWVAPATRNFGYALAPLSTRRRLARQADVVARWWIRRTSERLAERFRAPA